MIISRMIQYLELKMSSTLLMNLYVISIESTNDFKNTGAKDINVKESFEKTGQVINKYNCKYTLVVALL